jgi:hypothetical protein
MRDITINKFKEWFDNPEEVLTNFILSKEKIMTVVFPKRGSVVISKEHAERLLRELQEKEEL